jgi:hypothetical protein
MGMGGIVSPTLPADNGLAVMSPHAVKLQVEPKVPKDCIFWLEADGWTGVCNELLVTVQGSSFEDVKKAMEASLREHIDTLPRENAKRTGQQAA